MRIPGKPRVFNMYIMRQTNLFIYFARVTRNQMFSFLILLSTKQKSFALQKMRLLLNFLNILFSAPKHYINSSNAFVNVFIFSELKKQENAKITVCPVGGNHYVKK